MFKSIQRIFEILDNRSRRRFALLILPMALTAGLELFSIALILPVVQVTVLGEVNYGPAGTLVAVLPKLDLKNMGYWVAVIFGAFFVIKNIFLLGTLYIVNATIYYANALYIKKLFQIYLHRPLVFHFKNNSGLLLRNLSEGVALTMDAARQTLVMVFDIMLIIAAISLLIAFEPLITMIVVLFLAVVAFIYYRILSPIFRYWGEQSLILEGERNKWVLQSLSGIRDIKITNSYDYLVSKVYAICRQHAKFYSRATSAIHIPRLAIESFVVVGFLVVVSILTSAGQPKGEIFTTIGLFGMAALRIMPSFNRMLSAASELRRLDSIIKTTHQAFSDCKKDETSPVVANKSQKVTFSKEIEISSLSYSYPDSDRKSLLNVSITIKKGEKIGFVGESGSGKSTFMNIILGLLEPTSGKVEVDGSDISENLTGWHKNFGFVPQEIFLLDDTLRRNIAFATQDADIDDSKIRAVLAMTQLKDLERDLENGLDTILGEQGTRLSGGQRQRVVIARALYGEPDILVFDEATSALDNATIREMSEALDSLSDNQTVIIVAHRVSSIKNCDRIVVMENGAITTVGTYEYLIKSFPHFRKLALVNPDISSIGVSSN